MNVLAGVGILSTPYTISEAGWISLALLLLFAFICCYTGILLRYCLESQEGIYTYPDIGQVAMGRIGRFFISVSKGHSIYLQEVYLCRVVDN